MDELLIKMTDITKSFPGVLALNKAKFELKKGEVHALVGENGAGKSTLMKILTGVYKKDKGSIFFKGEEIDIANTKAAQELGISIIFQEFNLMPHLTVAQNVFIGREPRSHINFLLNEKEINRKTQELLDLMHLNIDPKTKVSDLTVAKQQMVEIVKALSFKSDVLIMDEPTAALTDTEIDELFRIIRHLRDKGVGIIHISHRIEELKMISDRITVMRDGCYVDTVKTEDISIDQIINMMVGRTIYETRHGNVDNVSNEIVLEIKNLNRSKVLKNINFNLRKGEILGFAGLMGAGRTEVARAIFGADSFDSGEIFIKGEKVNINDPCDAVKKGIGYLSEDRKRFGLATGMEVETNIVMATFKYFTGFLGWVMNSRIRKTARKITEELQIKTPSLQQKVKYLSGGNQQKVVVGKWLTRNCDILIFDEPTRGIDVGAKSEIYKLLNSLAESGKSIIMISSELPEIIRMSHRIVIMCEGRITGEINCKDATQELIMQYATKRE